MTGPDLTAFRKRHPDLRTMKGAAEAFGVSRDSWASYEKGERPIPLVLRWALAAYERGIPAYE